KEDEREDQRRPGALADDLAVGTDLSSRRGADRPEDAGADHRADRQHDQIARAERPLQAVLASGVLDESRDRLPPKQLRHMERDCIRSGLKAGHYRWLRRAKASERVKESR